MPEVSNTNEEDGMRTNGTLRKNLLALSFIVLLLLLAVMSANNEVSYVHDALLQQDSILLKITA